MIISASHITLLDLGLNLHPSVAPLDHLCHIQHSSGGVAVVELKHYGVGLTAVHTRVFPEVIEYFFRLIVLQSFVESPQTLFHLLRPLRIPASVRHADAGAAVRRVSIRVSAANGEGVERLTPMANRARFKVSGRSGHVRPRDERELCPRQDLNLQTVRL